MIHKNLLDEKINAFKADLKKYSTSELVQKRIIFGDCQVIDAEKYFELRLQIAKQFNVHPNEVLVVGSAKLGFSIAPKKVFRHFGDKSDIDVVIVSEFLFDEVWQSVYSFWRDKVIWESENDFKKISIQGVDTTR